MHHTTLRISCVFFTLLLSVPVTGQEWSQFRGSAAGHSASKSLPTSWSSTENVKWRTKVPGNGWSSPVLSAGRVYLTTAVPVGDGLSLRAVCLEAKTGRIVWNEEVFATKQDRIHRKNSYASPTPIVTKNRLFVHFGHQGSACLDLQGKTLWKQTGLSYSPVHGNGGSQILEDGRLYFSIDGARTTVVVALNAETGKVEWKTDRLSEASKKFSFTTPLAITVKGRKQIISPASDLTCAFDAKTGEEIWRVTYDGYSLIPKPVYGNGLVYICTGYGSPKLLAVRPDGKGDVTDTHIAWRVRKSVPHTPSLMLIKDRLFMVSDNGRASCLDAKTGRQIWLERLKGKYSASPIYANGLIYFQDEVGRTTIVRASDRFQVVGNCQVAEETLASFAVGENEIYLRSVGFLYRIER